MAEQINLSMAGKATEALFAAPSGDGPFPGVLVCYHGPGLDAFTEKVLDRLAEAGYVALAPPLLSPCAERHTHPRQGRDA